MTVDERSRNAAFAAESADRFALFNPEDQFQEMFALIRPLINREAEEVARTFWRAMERHASVRKELEGRDREQLIHETAEGFGSQFVSDLDAAWCERISRHGDYCYDLDIPGRSAIAAIVEAYDHLIGALQDEIPPQYRKFVQQTFSRMAALEHELVLTRINDRQKQDEHRRIAELSETFDRKLAGAIGEVADMNRKISEQSRAAAENARALLRLGQDIMAAAQQSTQAMGMAAEESARILHSIDGVAERLDGSCQEATDAQGQAQANIAVAEDLAASAEQIHGFATLISEIADKTRLLALNAAIEAAHAGDHGKGFAVVANEVKHLATEAGKATETAEVQVSAMSGAVTRSVNSNVELGATIGKLAETVEQAQQAMTLQRGALASITSSIDETSVAVSHVAQQFERMVEAARVTETDMTAADGALHDAHERLTTLQSEARAFLARLSPEKNHAT